MLADEGHDGIRLHRRRGRVGHNVSIVTAHPLRPWTTSAFQRRFETQLVAHSAR